MTTRLQLADRLIFGGCLTLAAAGFVLSWVLRQIDRATTYGPVTR